MGFKTKRIVPPSPDAAELGKYGNLPISLFSGTPNISIPLYEFKGNSLGLPISLSYNASGFKPADAASWVGLGWTLNAGGVITRAVIGNPDNSSNYFFANNNYQTPPSTDNLFANYDFMDSMQKGYKETQPDMYYYNFGGISGKFWMTTDQQIMRKDKNNLKITSSGVPNDGTGTSFFQIVDEKGNTYRFDQTEISHMLMNDAVDGNHPVPLNYAYPSSWYLSSITSADGLETISFSYYNAPNYHTLGSNFLQGESYTYYRTSNSTSSYYFDAGCPVNYGASPLVTLYNKRYLQSITFSRLGSTIATVALTLAANQRQDLDDVNFPGEQIPQSLTINSYNGAVKKFNFYYSYFTNSSHVGQVDYMRLRLDSVSEAVVDGSGLYKPPYSFVYDNSQMASQSHASLDHWGFGNGGDATTLVPRIDLGDANIYGGNANREPNLSGSMTGILKQIKYPTGGYTAFTYELNKGGSDNHDVGGVRVLQMIDYSFPGKPAVIKNYQYLLPDGSCSGLASSALYYSTSSMHHYPEPILGTGCTYPACTKGTDYIMNMMTVSASGVGGLGTIQGSHIGYQYVTEYQTDEAGNPLGKTVYHYDAALPSAHDDYLGSGELLDKSVYDGGGKLLDKVVNTYDYNGGDGGVLAYTAGAVANQDNHYVLCQYSSGGTTLYTWMAQWETSPTCIASRLYTTKYNYASYSVVSQYKKLLQEVHTIYDQQSNNYLTITKKYTYGSAANGVPSLIEQFSSSNDEIVTSKKYAADYTIPGSGTFDNATNGIKALQTKNMVTQEVESVIYRQNQDGSNKRYIDGMLNFYDAVQMRPTSMQRLELAAPITTLTASTTNGTFTYDVNYKPMDSLKYELYGNLNEQSKASGMVTSYIWDYAHSLPVAEVKNATSGMIAYTGFESGTDGGRWTINAGAMTAGGRAGVKSYNLTSTNTTVSSFPTGRNYTVSYWLHNGTVSATTNIGSAAAVTGAVYNGWTYVEHLLPPGSTQVTLSSAAGANIDELRLFPQDALMTTFTYIPEVGMTSQCTPANQFSFFQYDGFSRLINVLDMGGNIVKNFKYNYGLGTALTPSSQTLFYNVLKQGTYTKQNCVSPAQGTPMIYTVPYGKYVSSVSQADADAKAQAELTANGQSYANTNGACLFWNVDKSGYFSKNDCTPDQGGSSCTGGNKPFNTLYDVPAHTYSSTISQADADSKAQADVNANGQTYANNHCTCSCAGEGKKIVNGVCETGTRHNSSSTQMANGTWQCIYYYQFSDGSVSQNYTTYGSSACPIQ
jgi:hypothetical protein